jgi:single-stranded-DNA-specific exonuclease
MLRAMITSTYCWRLPVPLTPDAACAAAGRARGLSDRLMGVLAARGVVSADDLAAFFAPAEAALHDPGLLPDADRALARVERAVSQAEKVMVYGDFDADGLTGLSILVVALRALGLDAEPYVPERLGDGHGLSMRAIERALAENRTLIVTADCGTSSGVEIDLAWSRGIDVLVTDHHHAATWPQTAVAVVNPQRADSVYPEKELTGAGVAWKVAHLLLRGREAGSGAATDGTEAAVGDATKVVALPQAVRDLADLAVIGTVADVGPCIGENRAIARIGLEMLRSGARPGLAALLERAGLSRARLCLDDIGFGIAPRLNAAGRMGEAARAARLLLATDAAEAEALAGQLEQANLDRREVTKSSLIEAREMLGIGPSGAAIDGAAEPPPAADTPPAALLVRGEWGVGIIGLIAGRLAEDLARPAIVATTLDVADGTLRASCRSGGGINLAEALIACDDILIRHGGHAAAAGFDIAASRWPEFVERFTVLAAAAVPGPAGTPELRLDVIVSADEVDFDLVRELALLDPTGPGNPAPIIAVTGLGVSRVRAAKGGATQLVLRRRRDVLDAVAFRRPDLATMVHEGDRIDVAARATVRSFGGFESLQLEVIDVSVEGAQVAPTTTAAAAV